MRLMDEYTLNQINAVVHRTQLQISELCGKSVLIQYIITETELPEKPLEVIIQTVIEEVCMHFNITADALTGKSQKRKIANPRFIAFNLLFSFGVSKSKIGRIFKRSHATVISGLKSFQDYYDTEDEFKNNYDFLYNKINHQ